MPPTALSRVAFNIAFRLRSSDLILVNAGDCQADPSVFGLFNRGSLIPLKRLLQRGARDRRGILTIVSVTIARQCSADDPRAPWKSSNSLCDAQFANLTGCAPRRFWRIDCVIIEMDRPNFVGELAPRVSAT